MAHRKLFRIGLSALSLSLLVTVTQPSLAGAETAKSTPSLSNATSLVVSPPTFDLTANPGDTQTESIRLENITNLPLPVTTSLESFVPLGTSGAVSLTPESSQYSLVSWISLTPRSTTIAPKSSATFQFTITVPINAEPGGKFGSIVFSTGSTSQSASSIGVSQRVGALVLLRVAGSANEQAKISNFQADLSYHKIKNTISFSTLVADTGNVQVKPIGNIVITNMFGHKVANIPFDSKYVLPGASRSFTSLWHHGFIFGRYTANQTLLYGTSNKIMTATTSFISIPWKLIITVLVLMVVLIFILWKGKTRLGKALSVLFGKSSAA